MTKWAGQSLFAVKLRNFLEAAERDVVVDAAIAIQVFKMNAFACLDSIAWIWVYEKDIKMWRRY
jgi:hypothetical protein